MNWERSRGQLKCDGTRAETRSHLSAKRTSPFKSAGASVQSTTGSRGVRISGSNAGYTMFQGSVKSTGYPLHSPVSPSLPPSRVSPCAIITFQLDSTTWNGIIAEQVKKWKVWRQDRTKLEPRNSWRGIRSNGYKIRTFLLVWRYEISTSKSVWSKKLGTGSSIKPCR